eukprot:jgi/Bigna1/144404/aug1.87_g19112
MDSSFWSLLGLGDCSRDAPTGKECSVDEYANVLEKNSFMLLAGFVLFFVFALCVVGFGCFCGRSKRPRTSSEKAGHSNPSTRKVGNINNGFKMDISCELKHNSTQMQHNESGTQSDSKTSYNLISGKMTPSNLATP